MSLRVTARMLARLRFGGFTAFCTVKVVFAEATPNGPRSHVVEAVTFLPMRAFFGVHDTEHPKPHP